MGDTAELIARLKHLVSLNEPKNGGPYQGAAAMACVEAMSEAADALSSLVRERDELRETNCKLHRRAQQAESDIRAGRDAIIKARARDQWGGTDREFLKVYHENRDLRSRATAAEADAARMREALEPFAEFGRRNVDDHGWKSNIHREGISVWFGPSEFRAAWVARNALGGKDAV